MHAPAPGRAAASRVARRAAAPQLAYTQLSRGAAPAFCLARSPTPGTSSTAAAIAQAVAMQAAPRHAHLPADDEVHAVVAVKALASESTAGPVEVLQWVPLCPRSNASRPRLVHGVKAPARSAVKCYHDIEAHLLKNANGSASAHKNPPAASEAARTRTPLRVPAAAACEQDLRQAESNAEILPRCSCCAVKPAPC